MAIGLLNKALAFDQLDRHDEEVEIYKSLTAASGTTGVLTSAGRCTEQTATLMRTMMVLPARRRSASLW